VIDDVCAGWMGTDDADDDVDDDDAYGMVFT